MALTFNGTTGISGVDGSSSAPALTGTDSNTGINFGSDIMGFATAGVERVKITSIGRVGIGEGTPEMALHITGDSLESSRIQLQRNSSSGQFGIAGGGATIMDARGTDGTDGHLEFYAGNTKRMEIDDNGHFRLHQPNRVTVGTSSGDKGLAVQHSEVLGSCLFISKTDNFPLMLNRNGSGNITQYRRNGLVKGQVDVNASRVAYQTTSDYRLKENVATLSNGITRLKDLKPCRFNFKDDAGNTVDGFLAHELQVVVPEAVSGTKDAVDSENNPDYQGADNSFIVPLLTAALQEAVGKIETLETKVAALEAA